MRDLSLHLLDLAQNSITAGASLVTIGITVDERVAPGRVFGMLLYNMLKYFSNPELLEQPPEEVRADQGHVARLPAKK